MRVHIASVKQVCLWIESHAEKAVKDTWQWVERFGAASGASPRWQTTYVRVSVPEVSFCAASQFPNCSSPLLFLFLLFLQHILFSHFCGPKNRHIGAVFAFLGHSRSKKQRKYRYFLGLGSLKPRYLRYFLLLEKHHCIYNVFWHWYLRSLQHVASRTFFMPKAPKNTVNYSVFALGKHQKNSKNPPKCAQNRHLNFFPTPKPEKRENTSRVKDFGGSAARAPE